MPVAPGASTADSTVAGCPPIVTVTAFVVWEGGESGAAAEASTAGSTGPSPAQEMTIVSASVTGLSAPTMNCVPSGWAPATSAAPLPDPSTVKTPGCATAILTGAGPEKQVPRLTSFSCVPLTG